MESTPTTKAKTSDKENHIDGTPPKTPKVLKGPGQDKEVLKNVNDVLINPSDSKHPKIKEMDGVRPQMMMSNLDQQLKSTELDESHENDTSKEKDSSEGFDSQSHKAHVEEVQNQLQEPEEKLHTTSQKSNERKDVASEDECPNPSDGDDGDVGLTESEKKSYQCDGFQEKSELEVTKQGSQSILDKKVTINDDEVSKLDESHSATDFKAQTDIEPSKVDTQSMTELHDLKQREKEDQSNKSQIEHQTPKTNKKFKLDNSLLIRSTQSQRPTEKSPDLNDHIDDLQSSQTLKTPNFNQQQFMKGKQAALVVENDKAPKSEMTQAEDISQIIEKQKPVIVSQQMVVEKEKTNFFPEQKVVEKRVPANDTVSQSVLNEQPAKYPKPAANQKEESAFVKTITKRSDMMKYINNVPKPQQPPIFDFNGDGFSKNVLNPEETESQFENQIQEKKPQTSPFNFFTGNKSSLQQSVQAPTKLFDDDTEQLHQDTPLPQKTVDKMNHYYSVNNEPCKPIPEPQISENLFKKENFYGKNHKNKIQKKQQLKDSQMSKTGASDQIIKTEKPFMSSFTPQHQANPSSLFASSKASSFPQRPNAPKLDTHNLFGSKTKENAPTNNPDESPSEDSLFKDIGNRREASNNFIKVGKKNSNPMASLFGKENTTPTSFVSINKKSAMSNNGAKPLTKSAKTSALGSFFNLFSRGSQNDAKTQQDVLKVKANGEAQVQNLPTTKIDENYTFVKEK